MSQPDRDVRGSDAATLHLLIVRFAAISAWLAAFVLTVAATLTGQQETLLQAVAAGCAGLFFTLQLLVDRVNALVALGFGILFVVATLPIFSGPESALGASMAVVAMAIVASIFVPRRHQIAYLGAGSVLMLVVPWLWAETVAGGILPAVIMVSSFLIGSIAFHLVRQRTIQADQQFRWLFDRAPVGLVEQDWSDAVAYIETLQPRDAEHLGEMLVGDPDLLARIISLVQIVQANDAACEILKVPRRRYLGSMRPERLDETSLETWVRQVVGMWTGRLFDVAEYETTDYHGNGGLWLEVRLREHPRVPPAARFPAARRGRTDTAAGGRRAAHRATAGRA